MGAQAFRGTPSRGAGRELTFLRGAWRARYRALALALAALAFVLVGCAVPARVAPAAPPDLVFVIPTGTFDAELRGEADAYTIPSELHVLPGQAIVVRNDDHAMHYFFDIPIAPGQTVTKSFSRPGTFGYGGGLSCSVSKTGSVTVVVEAAKS